MSCSSSHYKIFFSTGLIELSKSFDSMLNFQIEEKSAVNLDTFCGLGTKLVQIFNVLLLLFQNARNKRNIFFLHWLYL